MPAARFALTDTLRVCLRHALRLRQSPTAGNRSEFGEEFGEGSLEPLTRAAERSRRSPPVALDSAQTGGAVLAQDKTGVGLNELFHTPSWSNHVKSAVS
jgi:hypothetical protein